MWGRMGFRKFISYSFFFVAALGAYDPNAAASAADKPKSWLERDQFTGDWGGGRAALANRGVLPYMTWTSQIIHNLDGGLRSGTDVGGVIEFGADLDLEKLGAWNGATIHASAFWIHDNDDPSGEQPHRAAKCPILSGLREAELFGGKGNCKNWPACA